MHNLVVVGFNGRAAGGGRGDPVLEVGGIEAGGDDGNNNLALQVRVDGGAKDNIGVAVGGGRNSFGGGVNFVHRHVHTADDVEQDAAGAINRNLQ